MDINPLLLKCENLIEEPLLHFPHKAEKIDFLTTVNTYGLNVATGIHIILAWVN